jgi:metal-sulfur cluster biosynthetic enzyme
MSSDDARSTLKATVLACLEAIVDPCSVAAGARAGLVSMGLVGDIVIEHRESGSHVKVMLHVTEPSCLMGAIFQANALSAITTISGVASAAVEVDRTHLWSPKEMSPEYQRRLADFRAAQSSRLTSLEEVANQSKGGT